MLTRAGKAAFYRFASPLMAINGYLYRALRAPNSGDHRVQLGPGRTNYLRGWINVDANAFTAKCDVWADLRHKLPFKDGTIEAFYSHHVVEHLPDLKAHVRDVYRCLRTGGVYRVGAPNGDSAVRKFLERDLRWFSDFPDRWNSEGGRLQNFLLCRNEHLAILTDSFLRELFLDAGFSEVKHCVPMRQTYFPDLFNECLSFEWEDDFECPHTLLLEAQK